MTPTVGLDVDGVLAEQNEPVAAFIRDEHGIDFDVSDITSRNPDIPEIGSTYVEQLKLARRRGETHVRDLSPIPGAVRAAGVISETARVEVVTHRRPDYREDTVAWLNEHDISYDDIHLPAPENKGETGVDLLVEDYPPNALDAVEAGCARAYVFIRHPHLSKLPFNHTRVETAADHSPLAPEELVDRPEKQWRILAAAICDEVERLKSVEIRG